MSNSGRIITRVVKEHRNWLQRTAQGVFEWSTQSLEDETKEASLPSLRCTKSSLDSFAGYYGTRGLVGLVDGKPTAWDNIYLGAAFHLHEIRLHYALWTRLGDEPGFTLETSKIACALCFSLANDLPDWTRLFTNMLGQAAWNDQMVKQVYWQERKFEPFVLRLAQIGATNGTNVPAGSESLGVYAAVLANWNSPALFSQAIESVCEYHCENMEDKGGNDDWDPEFDHPPFDLVPWEILAIRQVRNRLELAMPEIRHPLLALTSTFVPRNQLPVDERLDAVERLRHTLGMSVRE